MSSSHPNPSPKRKRKEPIGFKVRTLAYGRGPADTVRAYVPASQSDADRLKPLRHKEGDLVFADFRKPRSPGFHKLAHAIGKLAVQNIEGFGHLTPHEALKRLQLESGVGCEAVRVNMNSVWNEVLDWMEHNFGRNMVTILRTAAREIGIRQKMIPVKVPRSLSYDSMDQLEFFEVVKGLCKFMALHYWPGMSPEEIEAMAEAMSGELDPAR